MQIIETRKTGIASLDYFSADFSENRMDFNGHKLILGEFSCDLANLSKEYMTELLLLGGGVKHLLDEYLTAGYRRDLFQGLYDRILLVQNHLKKVRPFQYFDFEQSRAMTEQVLSAERLDAYDEYVTVREEAYRGNRILSKQEVKKYSAVEKDYLNVAEVAKIYCYIPTDTAVFATVLQNFTMTFMKGNLSRGKAALAMHAYSFFTSNEIMEMIDAANPAVDGMAGFTLRPRQTAVPVVKETGNQGEVCLAKRIYFGRLMDFFVTEFFEALSQGHYLWQCQVCGTYLFMRTARKQLYCSTVNPAYGVPCSYVAKHPEILHRNLERQSKKDGPLYDIWKKRGNSIRKNKSLSKYSEAISAEAKRLIDEKFERAQIDFEYAEEEYEREMLLASIYGEALKNTGTGTGNATK